MSFLGPRADHDGVDHDQLSTPSYLQAYAAKARNDLYRVATLYNGVAVKIYTLDESSDRCPDCTDSFTGDIVISNCKSCGGTGFISSYHFEGGTFAIPQLSPKFKTSNEMGDMEAPQQHTWVLIGTKLLEDQDIIVTVATERIYKIVDTEPQLAAIGGEIITQTVTCRAIAKGAPEYQILLPIVAPEETGEEEEEEEESTP